MMDQLDSHMTKKETSREGNVQMEYCLQCWHDGNLSVMLCDTESR